MFLLDAPPDTSAYMIAGYTAFAVLSSVYILSLFVRWHNLEQDRKTLEELQKDAQAKPPKRRKK